MNTSSKPLEELLQELPPHIKNEVRDFVEFLLSKQNSVTKNSVRFLRQDWADQISIPEYSSVELQHLANTWREE